MDVVRSPQSGFLACIVILIWVPVSCTPWFLIVNILYSPPCWDAASSPAHSAAVWQREELERKQLNSGLLSTLSYPPAQSAERRPAWLPIISHLASLKTTMNTQRTPKMTKAMSFRDGSVSNFMWREVGRHADPVRTLTCRDRGLLPSWALVQQATSFSTFPAQM